MVSRCDLLVDVRNTAFISLSTQTCADNIHRHVILLRPVSGEADRTVLVVVDPAFSVAEVVELTPVVVHCNSVEMSERIENKPLTCLRSPVYRLVSVLLE